MKPHKHAELIKLWADGAVIESFNVNKDKWEEELCPVWQDELTYRIKPEPKPDVVRFVYVSLKNDHIYKMSEKNSNVKLTFDGETGELKSAEVMK